MPTSLMKTPSRPRRSDLIRRLAKDLRTPSPQRSGSRPVAGERSMPSDTSTASRTAAPSQTARTPWPWTSRRIGCSSRRLCPHWPSAALVANALVSRVWTAPSPALAGFDARWAGLFGRRTWVPSPGTWRPDRCGRQPRVNEIGPSKRSAHMELHSALEHASCSQGLPVYPCHHPKPLEMYTQAVAAYPGAANMAGLEPPRRRAWPAALELGQATRPGLQLAVGAHRRCLRSQTRSTMPRRRSSQTQAPRVFD
ncbi:hypothetical protein PsYK624_171350 [Phanerochaete sordida]|uniref:Uncharacterized protein n=1 Tax=Phanerochaete sordida TaxID=48140 RepID=A0A9P3GS15_9APHY|nr:hypothetical protein PsYK624_171350 [Phanerochaete sordida]